MRMIVMMLGLFLAMGQMANAAPQTKAEALLQITKLLTCNSAYLNGLKNFSQNASLRQRMEKVVKKFQTLCNTATRNPEEATSLRDKFVQHNRGARYKLVSRTYERSSLDEKVHMQESFQCANRNATQGYYSQVKEVALKFASTSETRSIKRTGKRLQKRWDKVCAMPRGTQTEKKKFIRSIPALWQAFREHHEAIRSVFAK